MFVVALLTLKGSSDDEAAALAKDLQLTLYEAGQRVRTALPSIVFRHGDVERAKDLARKLHARGHEVVLLDAAQVPASDAMPRVKQFRLDADALVSLGPAEQVSRLAWADVVALVAAVHQGSGTQTEVSRERKFSLGRAVLTQGLSMHKTVERESTHAVSSREPVLYLFHRGGPAWVVSENGCRYDGLGPLVRPARIENFQTLVRVLRERCPPAPFDERLVHVRHVGEKVSGDLTGHAAGASNVSAVDVLAHVVAAAVLRRVR